MGGGNRGGTPTVIVAGALANKLHNGGEAWVRLSWALGFQKLGCDVYFVEQIEPGRCVDADGRSTSFENSANVDYFTGVTEQFGLAGRATLICDPGDRSVGLSIDELCDVADSADLLVNISGHLRFDPLFRRMRRTAFVDIDPGFTQFWHDAGLSGGRIPPHDHYFTIGENIGTADCPIPTGEITWRTIRQPVVLDEWPVRPTDFDRFTTIANWRGPFGPVEHRGRSFGLKVHEFRKFLPLPRDSPQEFEIALTIDPAEQADLTSLREHGWRMVDPRRASGDPAAFRRYIQDSGAEFSAAQGVYVDTACGWFSDRTVRYLASGRPALVQDTGFSRNLPVGEGLLAFRTLADAVAGAESITSDYAAHSRAARALAEEYFGSDRVLTRMLEETRVGG